MSGDPNNAAVWANADVFIGGLTANIPTAGDPFDNTWDYVGLLNGDDGFTQSESFDTNDFFAWGVGIIATTRKNFKVRRSFTAFEENQTVYDLLYPGHTVVFDGLTGGYEGDVFVPDLSNKFRIGWELRSSTAVRRLVSANYAQIDERPDSKEGENDLASHPITVAVYPDSTGKLFHTFRGVNALVSSIAVTPSTATKAVGATQQLSVVATMADASTPNVTGEASYSSSNTAKATVTQQGLIKAVATGSATITATYGGRTGTCVVTVS